MTKALFCITFFMHIVLNVLIVVCKIKRSNELFYLIFLLCVDIPFQFFIQTTIPITFLSIHYEFLVVSLTLVLLMSYVYGAPSKARNANVVYIWTYVWQH